MRSRLRQAVAQHDNPAAGPVATPGRERASAGRSQRIGPAAVTAAGRIVGATGWPEASRAGRAHRPTGRAGYPGRGERIVGSRGRVDRPTRKPHRLIASIAHDAKSLAGRRHRDQRPTPAATLSWESGGWLDGQRRLQQRRSRGDGQASGRTAGHGQSSTPTAWRQSPGREGVGISCNVVGVWQRVSAKGVAGTQRLTSTASTQASGGLGGPARLLWCRGRCQGQYRRRPYAPSTPGSSTAALEALLPNRWVVAHPEHRLEQREEESREAQVRRRRKRAARRLAVTQ